MKKGLSVVLAMSIFGMSLSACSSSTGTTSSSNSTSSDVATASNGNDKVTEIKILETKADPNNSFYNDWMAQVDRFNQAYSGQYKLVPEATTDEQHNEKMQQLAMADQLPPVFVVEHNPDWYWDVVVKGGLYYDVSGFINNNPDLASHIPPESLDLSTQTDGTVVSVPYLIVRPKALTFYNEQLMTPSQPIKDMTTEDFQTALGDTKMTVSTTDNAWCAMLYFTDLVALQPGGVDELQSHAVTHETDFTSDIWVNAATELQNALQNYCTPGSVGNSFADAENEFVSDNASVIINGSWMQGDLSQENADKWSPDFDVSKVHVDTMPGNISCSELYTTGYSVAKHSSDDEIAGALAYIQFVDSDPELEAMMLGQGGNVENFTPSDDFLQKLKENPMAYEIYNAPNADTTYVPEIETVMPTSVADSDFGTLLPKLADGSMTPSEFCQQLTVKAQQADQ